MDTIKKYILILCSVFLHFATHAEINAKQQISDREAAYLVTSSAEATKALFTNKDALNTKDNKFSQEEQFIEACKKEREIIEKVLQQPIDQEKFEEQIKKVLSEKKLFQDCDLNKGLEAEFFKKLKTSHSERQARSACFSPSPDYDASYDIFDQRTRLAALLAKKENAEIVAPLIHELITIEKQLQENEKAAIKLFNENEPIWFFKKSAAGEISLARYLLPSVGEYFGGVSVADINQKTILGGIAFVVKGYFNMGLSMLNSLKFAEFLKKNTLKKTLLLFFIERITSPLAVLNPFKSDKKSCGGVLSPSIGDFMANRPYHSKDDILKYTMKLSSFISLTQLISILYKSVQNTGKMANYYALINKKLQLTQELAEKIKDICKDDQAILEAFPEYKLIQKSFEDPEKHFCKDTLTSLTTGAYGKLMYLFPGLLSHFYSNKLEPALPTINTTINRFISSIDLSCVAAKLVTESNGEYSIPALTKSTNSTPYTINLEDFVHPKLTNPIKNSLDLNENKFLVSPTGSGKTLVLTSIMANLMMANLGVWRVKNGTGVYCNNFNLSLDPEYEIGDRASRYMTELSDTHTIVEELKNTTQPALLLSDEPLHSTQEKAAAIMLKKHLDVLSKNHHVKSIIPTHNIPAIGFVENKDAKTGILFTEVKWDANNIPTNTYKLKNDILTPNSENWWRNDFAKVVEYEKALEKRAIQISDEKRAGKEAALNAMLRAPKKEASKK